MLDLAATRTLRSLGGTAAPTGILFLPARDRLVVACAGSGTCEVFDGATLERVTSVAVGDDADNLRVEPRAGRVVVGSGAGALVLLDPASWTRVGAVPLPAHPESFQLEPDGRHAWVNLPGAGRVARAELEAHTLGETWVLHDEGGNYPMALVPADPATDEPGLLLVGCRAPPHLLVRTLGPEPAVTVHALSGDADDLFYDPTRRRVYAVCGAGRVDVLQRESGNTLRPLAQVETAPGARTGLLVPELARLFVAVPRRGSAPAEVRVLATGD